MREVMEFMNRLHESRRGTSWREVFAEIEDKLREQ
jgi:hypothetical protein